MSISASRLRENIYRLLDEILETGEPLEIERNGEILQIVRVLKPKESRLERLKGNGHPGAIIGDPEDLVHIDWSVYWNPDPT